MKTSCALVLLCTAVLASAACGGSGGSSAGVSAQSGEAAYEKAYRNAWITACKRAVADIHRRDRSRRVGRVKCRRPAGQQEGNLAVDPKVAPGARPRRGHVRRMRLCLGPGVSHLRRRPAEVLARR